jgi:hypothetical protein
LSIYLRMLDNQSRHRPSDFFIQMQFSYQFIARKIAQMLTNDEAETIVHNEFTEKNSGYGAMPKFSLSNRLIYIHGVPKKPPFDHFLAKIFQKFFFKMTQILEPS